MKTSIIVLPALLTLAAARDNIFNFNALIKARSDESLIHAREVPQEHSHEKFLRLVQASLILNNPNQIADAVFGLLGAKAAAGGEGKITDPNCLQQATADQAFTNAKKVGDITGMTAALVYRTLERNSGAVGALSPLCNSTQAVNPEIAALQQHQDPASTGAAALNKKIALELARQIKSIGGDPLVAIQSGTFAAGSLGDTTAKGNTCDSQDDTEGCIFIQNLLVPDVSAQEISSALATATATSQSASTTTSNTSATTTEESTTTSDVSDSSTATTTEEATTTQEAITTSDVSDSSTATTAEQVTTTQEATTTETDATPVTTSAVDTTSTDESSIAPSTVTIMMTTTAISMATITADCTASAIDTSSETSVSSAPSTVTVMMTTTTVSMVTVTADCTSTAGEASAATTSSVANLTSTPNLQSFTGDVGVGPIPIENVGGSRPFVVNGDSFVNFAAACQRSCDVQHNKCANVANAGGATFKVSDCDVQDSLCGTNCKKGPE